MIYSLRSGLGHIEEGDDYCDAVLIEFDRYLEATFLKPGVDYHALYGAPKVIEFVADLERISSLNCLLTIPDFLLLSRRLVQVLASVGPFRYRLIPVIIYAKRIAHLVQDRRRQRTFYQVEDPSVRCDDFVILQLEDTLDCMDHERTFIEGKPFREYGRELITDNEPDLSLVLKEPEGGFPPIFYVPEIVAYLFSEEAKQACDAAGLQDLWWLPQPVPPT